MKIKKFIDIFKNREFHLFEKWTNILEKLNCFKKRRFLKISKKWNFGNQIVFFWKSKFSKILPKMTLSWKTYARWESHSHYHLVHILTKNESSIHREHLACGTFSSQVVFVHEKHDQTVPSYKKSRCSWDGVYLRTRITLRALPSNKQ